MQALRIFVLSTIVLILFLENSPPQRDCQSVRKGKFYFQPKNSGKKYFIIRTAFIQKEVEVNSIDTSYWKIKWIADCKFTLEFSHKTGKMTVEEKSYYTSHKLLVEILNVKKNYYSFKADLDSISGRPSIDTLWMKP